MPDESPESANYRELMVERLVLMEPGTRRARAVLETLPAAEDPDSDHGTFPRPRLQLFDAAGDPVVTVELDGHGAPSVQLGLPGQRASVVGTERSIAIWKGGNEVAVMDAPDGGRVTVADADGRVVKQLP